MKEESGPSTAASSEERPSRVPSWLVVFAAFLGAVVGVIVARLVLFGLAGKFGAGNTVWDYRFAGKTVWNYLDVFLVPVAVALVTLWLTLWEDRRQRKYEAVQQRLQEQAEDAQRERELAVESQRAQDEALQAYLDQMSQLLIEQPLRRARPGDNLSTVARARTLTVLTRLDGVRKASVVRFLYEADLITDGRVVLDLSEADLSGAFISGLHLRDVNLSKADLSGADLSSTLLREINLRNANLNGADLHALRGRNINLWDAQLSRANLSEATLLNPALNQAKLIGTNLHGTKLIGAKLYGADLREADLSGADLSKVEGLNNTQIGSCMSLEGATMPNGQKYEDWLKDRKGRKEDGVHRASWIMSYEDWLKSKGRGEDGENGGPP